MVGRGLLFALTLCAVGVFGCEEGWTAFSGSCYIHMPEAYSWFNAKTTCEILDAKLVEINIEAENEFVKKMIHSNAYMEVWIGLEDFFIEGSFTWTSSQEAPVFVNWQPGEPNDFHLTGNGWKGEDCTAINNADGRWNDLNCEKQKRTFICEREDES